MLICKAIVTFLFFSVLCKNANAQHKADTIRVFFDIDKSVVDDRNSASLNKIIDLEGVMSICIYGYTDFLGSASHNQQLSEKRSDNVRNYLFTGGIGREYVVISGGEGIHPNSSEENRQDLSDRGIKEHRVVLVVYTTNLQEVEISEEDAETLQESGFSLQESEFSVNGNEYSSQEELAPAITNLTEENLVTDNIIVMERIFFQYNTYEFSYMAYPALYELLGAMREYNSLKIEIHGHICCFNNEFRNDVITLEGIPLSVGRAKAVHDFLIENGISSDRLSYEGFGNTRRRYPLEQNEYERAMNRRVEILVVER